jgi:hypothetical protein
MAPICIESTAKSNLTGIRRVRRLLRKGWVFLGSIFRGSAEQDYELQIKRHGKTKFFLSSRPYPDVVDGGGKIHKIK